MALSHPTKSNPQVYTIVFNSRIFTENYLVVIRSLILVPVFNSRDVTDEDFWFFISL